MPGKYPAIPQPKPQNPDSVLAAVYAMKRAVEMLEAQVTELIAAQVTKVTGAVGATGAKGSLGVQGDEGEQGPTGPPGLVGPTGPAGPMGPIMYGDEGDEGAPGVPGLVGPTGPAGPMGPIMYGDEGDQGLPGPPGLIGSMGPAGPMGPMGFPGDDGDPAIGWMNSASPPKYCDVIYTGTLGPLTTGTFVKVPFDSKASDDNNWFDNVTNFRFQPTAAGYYLVYFQCYNAGTAGPASGGVYPVISMIQKNGATHIKVGGLYQENTAAANSIVQGLSPVTAIVSMNGTTDYLEFFTFTNLASCTLTGDGAGQITYMFAVKLGALTTSVIPVGGGTF